MKKYLSIKHCIVFFVFVSLVFVLFTACKRKSNLQNEDGKLNIVATIFPQYDFIRQIVGDRANVEMLLPPGAESHSFEPTPQDIIKIQDSDIFVYVGGESDTWVNQILSSMDTKDKSIVALMEIVKPVKEEIVEGMQDDEEEETEAADGGEETDEEYDEHVWTSPKNAKIIVAYLAKLLMEKDPKNADFYKQNADNYIKQLDEVDAEFRQIVNTGKRKVIVFGDRFPLRYFADYYGLQYYAAFPGCSTETEASAATIKFLIDKVRADRIPVVFYIEFSNQRIAKAIAESTKAKTLLFQSAHNVTKAELTAGITYVELMRQNAKNLREALN